MPCIIWKYCISLILSSISLDKQFLKFYGLKFDDILWTKKVKCKL